MMQEFTQEVKNTISELLHDVHTAIPGKIVAYYPDKCVAEISPYGKFKKPNGEFMNYPQLNNVPVMFPQSCGQEFAIVYPINSGDECLVFVQEQTLDVWRGAGSESNNDLRFDLTNAVAVVGLFAKPQPLAKEAQDSNTVIIQKGSNRVQIGASGVTVKGDTTINGALTVSGDIDAQGDVNISGTLTLAGINMNTHTHGGVTTGSGNTGQPK